MCAPPTREGTFTSTREQFSLHYNRFGGMVRPHYAGMRGRTSHHFFMVRPFMTLTDLRNYTQHTEQDYDWENCSSHHFFMVLVRPFMTFTDLKNYTQHTEQDYDWENCSTVLPAGFTRYRVPVKE